MPKLTKEQWRPIIGLNGRYEVSNIGRVRGLYKSGAGRHLLRSEPRIMALSKGTGGYIRFRINGKCFLVHRLVCEAFHGPCPMGHQSAHINGCSSDNREENLMWATPVINMSHRDIHGTSNKGEAHGLSKLSIETVRNIRLMHKKGKSQRLLAAEFGISTANVCLIVNRKTWSHI